MPKYIILNTDLRLDGQFFPENSPIELTDERAALLAPYLQELPQIESAPDAIPEPEQFKPQPEDNSQAQDTTSNSKKGRK